MTIAAQQPGGALWCLTVRQPMAFLIARGFRPVEIRLGPIPERMLGRRICLRAAAATRDPVMVMPERAATQALIEEAIDGDADPLLARGALIAVLQLRSCHQVNACAPACCAWARPGQWHWEVAEVIPLARPVPFRDKLDLRPLPAYARRAVGAQLAAQLREPQAAAGVRGDGGHAPASARASAGTGTANRMATITPPAAAGNTRGLLTGAAATRPAAASGPLAGVPTTSTAAHRLGPGGLLSGGGFGTRLQSDRLPPAGA